mgnify:CR=1 FL=1
MKAALLTLALLLWALAPARAALTSNDLAEVRVDPPAGAALPRDQVYRDEHNQSRTIGDFMDGRPAVLVFADYTCQTLCGPAVSLAAAALQESGLRAGRDYVLLVVGIDPHDGIADAKAMKQTRIGDPAIAGASRFLVGDAETEAAATAALGYHYVYDPDIDQYAHPAAAFVLRPDGGLQQSFAGFDIQPEPLKTALQAASTGSEGGIVEQIRILCYALTPAVGIYSDQITLALQAGGALTVLGLGAAGAVAFRRRGRRKA